MSRRGVPKAPKWDGFCAAKKHGLDFETQQCDSCAILEDPLAALMRRTFDDAMRGLYGRLEDRQNQSWLKVAIVVRRHMREQLAAELRQLGEIEGADALAAPAL